MEIPYREVEWGGKKKELLEFPVLEKYIRLCYFLCPPKKSLRVIYPLATRNKALQRNGSSLHIL